MQSRFVHIDQDTYYAIVHKVINDNLPMIVRMAQEYLSKYERGVAPAYCTNIDAILLALYPELQVVEVAAAQVNMDST